ncbi:hypothetical protein MY3296_008321 [Beauveria thailandica]
MSNPVLCPYRVVIDLDDTIINTIMAPLRDNQKLDLLWSMGKALVEPEGTVMVFYGRDGKEGKTKQISSITSMFTNAVECVSEDLVRKESKWPGPDTIMYLCDKKFLVCDECKIEEGFSYHNIKRWASGAPVSMEGRTGYLSHTLFVTANQIPNEKTKLDRVTTEIQMVCKNLNKDKSMTIDMTESPVENIPAHIFDHILSSMTDTNKPGHHLCIDVVTMTFVAGEIRTGMGEDQYGYTTLKSFRNRVEYLDKIKSGVMQMNV